MVRSEKKCDPRCSLEKQFVRSSILNGFLFEKNLSIVVLSILNQLLFFKDHLLPRREFFLQSGHFVLQVFTAHLSVTPLSIGVFSIVRRETVFFLFVVDYSQTRFAGVEFLFVSSGDVGHVLRQIIGLFVDFRLEETISSDEIVTERALVNTEKRSVMLMEEKKKLERTNDKYQFLAQLN